MTFTYDVTTARGKVRSLVGDTDTTNVPNQLFTDAEVDAFLEQESNDVYAAAALACESAAARLNRNAASFDKNTVQHFIDLAERYRTRSIEQPMGEQIDAMDYRTDSFGRDKSEYVGDLLL